MRLVVIALLRLVCRVFFARADVTGRDLVPKGGPLIIVVNHPNALIDAAVIFALTPRRVAMLAKETLFAMPVIGLLIRGMDSLPVARRQDAAAGASRAAANRATFAAARDLLQRGRALALFPEGASHDGGALLPLKTGAARIALGAAALQEAGAPPVQVLPASLFYTDKGTLRRGVLLQFGLPLAVPRLPLDGGEPGGEAVRALTGQIAAALGALTLQPGDRATGNLLARAAQILATEPGALASLADIKALSLALARGRARLEARAPGELASLTAAVADYDRALTSLGVPASADLAAPAGLWRLVALLPLALVGLPSHYPAYRLIGALAMRRAAGEEDMLATLKVVSALVFFPLTWGIAAAALLLLARGAAWPLVACLPASGYAALLFAETLDARRLQRRARRAAAALAGPRRAIRDQLVALERRLNSDG